MYGEVWGAFDQMKRQVKLIIEARNNEIGARDGRTGALGCVLEMICSSLSGGLWFLGQSSLGLILPAV